jgi:hypothetical protein
LHWLTHERAGFYTLVNYIAAQRHHGSHNWIGLPGFFIRRPSRTNLIALQTTMIRRRPTR